MFEFYINFFQILNDSIDLLIISISKLNYICEHLHIRIRSKVKPNIM